LRVVVFNDFGVAVGDDPDIVCSGATDARVIGFTRHGVAVGEAASLTGNFVPVLVPTFGASNAEKPFDRMQRL
jgi:hypothetical protein